jgi:PAS domain S-box-containing protein
MLGITMKKGIKLLILEDVPLDAELAERELKREGLRFSSIRVETKDDFLKALDEFIPDIILADHSLPHFDGLSALKLTLEKSPNTPFIFVSGKIGEDFAVEMLKEGATDYVLKNNLSKLYLAVSRALKESEEQKERKIAEKSLMESEKKYRNLFENSRNPIFVCYDDGKLIDCNDAASEFMEISKEDLTGQNIYGWSSKDQLVINLEKTKEIEMNFQIAGKEKILEISSTKVDVDPVDVDHEGLFFLQCKDITLQKKAEKALKDREEEYRLLVENQNDLIIKFDLKGILLFVSTSFCDLFGKDKKEFLGKNFLEVVSQKNPDSTKSSFKKLFEPPYSGFVEQEILTKNGLKYISWANKAVMDENNSITAFVGVGRDITLQKKVENDLIESESKYRAIFENTGTLTLIFEKDMTISLVNEEFEKFSLYSKAEIESKHSWLDFVAPADVERMAGYNRLQRINPDAIPKNYEVRLINKQGTIKDFFATSDMIPSTNKGLISLMDITDRKIAENKIKDSLKEKELLLREIHHRVKNNLQIISTLLTLQSAKFSDEKIINMYRESQNRIQSIALIHEKLYHSQNISKINLQDYVQSMVSDLFYSFGTDEKFIDAELDVDDVSMGLETAIPCGLIINELVSNSLKYAFPDDKGKIKVELHLLNGDEYLLKVSDDGVGLPADFEMENTETLGLQIVDNLVKQIEGKLEISKPSEFKIMFKEIKYKERI